MASNRTRLGRVRAAVVPLAGIALALALAGCTASPVVDSTPRPPSTPAATAAPSASPEPAPATASDRLPDFDAANRKLLATVPTPSGQQIVENLVAAGFVKADMEITPDTTIGKEAAGSIQFSVRVNGGCLIGQTGEAGYNAIAAPLLGTGKCLVGATRTIDF